MAASSVAIKQERREDGNLQNETEDREPVTLDYNAIYGNMYRDFMANNTNTASNDSTATTTTSATPENCKVAIPPECYAESFDIQDVVNEFKVTLEKFGVSQRFAAKYIMEDTSQGNLSFLMDKGKRLTWAELSPKGRIPYVKMKQWLDSKEKQMNTIEIVKENKAMTRQNAGKDAFQRRERFSLFQLTVLCRLFEENSNPSMTTRAAIAEKLNIPPERINVWFQNQRARGFPAKRILQQSFNAASSTNGAARSASIMNTVAMEIVNQSKTDTFLANNTALVNQFVENSLHKADADDNDVHRLLLQYSSHSDLPNTDLLSSSTGRNENTKLLPSNGKRSSGGSQKSNKSGEISVLSKIKTEIDDTLNREMTADEKVNGYLNHLSQTRSKSAYGSQLDSVVKRITQSQSSALTHSQSSGITQTQSGAAKRKPAFLNKMPAQPKGGAVLFDQYASPYNSPASTSPGMLYDSSPLSALYRQTASVNFTPPNPSFNYLFDIGASTLMPPQANYYMNRLDITRETPSESRKRLHNEDTGEFGLDLKRKKTLDTMNGSQRSGKRSPGSDSASLDSNKGNAEMTQSERKVRHKGPLQERQKELDTMKVPVAISEKSMDDSNIPQQQKSDKYSVVNILNKEKETESENDPSAANSEGNEIIDSGKRDITLQDDSICGLNTAASEAHNNGEKQTGEQNGICMTVKSAEANENTQTNGWSHNKLTEFEVVPQEENSDLCSERKSTIDCSEQNDNNLSASQREDKQNKTDSAIDGLTEEAEKNSESKDQNNRENNGGVDADNCSNASDIDKPLSKDEMKLFKSLYARFVKYHFAQMQFPEIK